MVLKADDGTPLEVKQATVLDQDGEVILEAPAPEEESVRGAFFQNGRVFQVQGAWLPVFFILGLLALSLGAVFIGVFLAIALVVTMIRKLLRSLSL